MSQDAETRHEDKEISVGIKRKAVVSVAAATLMLAAMVNASEANATPAPGLSTGSANLDCFIQILLHGEVPGVC